MGKKLGRSEVLFKALRIQQVTYSVVNK
jgi:hypothetical protein